MSTMINLTKMLQLSFTELCGWKSSSVFNFIRYDGNLELCVLYCSKLQFLKITDPSVKAILVNVFGGIVNCATIAGGVIAACKNIGLKVPLIVRLEGKVE